MVSVFLKANNKPFGVTHTKRYPQCDLLLLS